MHQTAYMSLRKPCQRFRFLFYLPLPRIPARMVLFYRLYIYLCPAILNAMTVISGSRFLGQHCFPENQLLTVRIRKTCRFFLFAARR